MIRAHVETRSVLMHGEYDFHAKLRNGRELHGCAKNFVPTNGRALFVNAYFGLGTFPALHMSIVNSADLAFATGNYQPSDDFQGPLDWAEFTGYADATRKAVTWSADAVDNKIETDFETFSMVSTTDRLSGVFLASGSAKTGVLSPVSGDELFSVAPWNAGGTFGFKRGLVFFLDEFTVKYRLKLFHQAPNLDDSGEFAFGGATLAALDDMLNVNLRGGTATNTWFVGFIDATSFSTISANDTLASHPGWFELTSVFGEGDRLAVSFSNTSTNGKLSTDVVSLSALDPGTLLGMFLTDQPSGTGGLLHSAIRFSGSLTPGLNFRRYDRLELSYGIAMDDISYQASL